MTRPTSLPLPVLPPQVPTQALEQLFGSARPQAHALDDGPGSREAGEVLLLVREALMRYRPGDTPFVFSLQGLPGEALARLTETLAEGEVTALVTGAHVFQLHETALPGVWHVIDTTAGHQYLEVGDVPQVLRAANDQGTCGDLSIGTPPEGAMNVLPLLAELRHRMKTWEPGDPNHVISFTLLPMNDVDMRTLEGQLKHGAVEAESRGYGRTRVELTGHRNVWSVQYFNSLDTVILDTLEVGDVPAALVAGAEDFEDSAQRLAEVLGV